MLVPCLFILAGLVLLVYGADRFVLGAAGTARGLGVPSLIIGLTVVGIATSFPEVLVGVVAALDEKTTLAIGNALGSNIANIGLVLGGTAIVFPLAAQSKTLKREFLIMCSAMFIAFIILIDMDLSRLDGIILLISLVCIIWWIVRIAKQSPASDPLLNEFEEELKTSYSLKISLLLMAAGLVLLLGGAELLVRGAVEIARAFGVSDLVIGLSIVAIGTSLPELAASIMSVIKKEDDIAIGNIIGSNMFNMLMVLGVPCIIYPAAFEPEVVFRDFLIMVILTVLMGLMAFLFGKGKFNRLEGGVLLSLFIMYQSWLYVSATT